jgi:hypothetical protein
LRLTAAGNGQRPGQADLVGAVLGSDADAAELLEQLVARAGTDPAAAVRPQLPYRAAKRYLAGLDSLDDQRGRAAGDQPPPGQLFTKSEFFRQPLPTETITALVEHLVRGVVGGHAREVTFSPWGGAYNRVPADATAFVHRAELFIDWAHAYYGDNYDRLLRVKARYDPTTSSASTNRYRRTRPALAFPWHEGVTTRRPSRTQRRQPSWPTTRLPRSHTPRCGERSRHDPVRRARCCGTCG